MVKRDALVAEARKWRGVSWQHQGRTRHGIDCAGLVVLVGGAFHQWTVEPISDYARRPNGTYLIHFRNHMVEKPVASALDGDVLIFSDSGHPCHSGIRTTLRGQPAVIHAHRVRAKVIEESLKSAESVIKQPIFCFAYPGVED